MRVILVVYQFRILLNKHSDKRDENFWYCCSSEDMSHNHCVFREPSLVLLQIISYVKDPYVVHWAWAYCESLSFIYYFSPEHDFSAEVTLPPKRRIFMSGDEKSICIKHINI